MNFSSFYDPQEICIMQPEHVTYGIFQIFCRGECVQAAVLSECELRCTFFSYPIMDEHHGNEWFGILMFILMNIMLKLYFGLKCIYSEFGQDNVLFSDV